MAKKIDLNERVANLEVEVAVLKNRIKILEQEGKSVTHNHYHPAPQQYPQWNDITPRNPFAPNVGDIWC